MSYPPQCRMNGLRRRSCWRHSGGPRVDTLKGSRYANMKELRFQADDGVWRVAFAFDPQRKAVLLVAGDKSGVNERRFYRQLIKRADARFGMHLDRLKDERRTR